MANMQLEAFGELFQSEEAIQRFRRHNYACPFDDRVYECDKPNRGELRYGNCTAKVGDDNIIICPRRFYENNFELIETINLEFLSPLFALFGYRKSSRLAKYDCNLSHKIPSSICSEWVFILRKRRG